MSGRSVVEGSVTSVLRAYTGSISGIPFVADRDLWRVTQAFAIACLVIGVVGRFSPLLDIDGRLFWQFMTEDGYLMQTVARNMAIGLGMTTADGTIPTNGVQPLATFIFAFMHWIVGGERVGAIMGVMAVSAVISILSAYLMYRLGQVLLGDRSDAREMSLLISSIWFVGPLTMLHHMNGLETGLYVTCMLATLLYYFGLDQGGLPLSLGQRAMLGFLLGVTFLARNDAVFFIAALLLAHLMFGARDIQSLSVRFLDCILAGVISIVVGAPWMLHNVTLYGTIVPISGLSQSHGATFGQNLPLVPANLLEAALPMLPLPRSFETMWPLILVSVIFLSVVCVLFWWSWARNNERRGKFFFVLVTFTLALSGYYGLFFGAPHFISRYLSILSPYLWFVVAVVAFGVVSNMARVDRLRGIMAAIALAAVLAASLGSTAHFYLRGQSHMHKQVVQWVQGHVEADQWVGAVQTGTLGYFHDKTLNLDGKVNPRALDALRTEGHVLNYVLSTPIAFIADWQGVADWPAFPNADRFRIEFETVVKDEAINLGVLRRKGQ